jgi:hypothetical protein
MTDNDHKEALSDFIHALSQIPDGYSEGQFNGRRWGVTIKRSVDGRRIWLFAEDLVGTDIISFNFYVIETGALLKPCEMSSNKLTKFVLGYRPEVAN